MFGQGGLGTGISVTNINKEGIPRETDSIDLLMGLKVNVVVKMEVRNSKETRIKVKLIVGQGYFKIRSELEFVVFPLCIVL